MRGAGRMKATVVIAMLTSLVVGMLALWSPSRAPATVDPQAAQAAAEVDDVGAASGIEPVRISAAEATTASGLDRTRPGGVPAPPRGLSSTDPVLPPALWQRPSDDATPILTARTDAVGAAAAGNATVTGIVRSAETGDPLDGACVDLYPYSSVGVEHDCTGPDGIYSFAGVAADTYYVAATDTLGIHAPSTGMVVAADGEVATLDLHLELGGVIAGTVVDPAGEPIAGACVHIQEIEGEYSYEVGCTATDGSYRSHGLPGGHDWTVLFFDPLGRFAPQVSPGVDVWSAAEAVTVPVGTLVSDVDASLVPGGRITGTVTASGTGAPLADVCVYTAVSFYGEFPDLVVPPRTCTGADGRYATPGLVPGQYQLSIYPTPEGPSAAYVSECYDDANCGDPTLVTVAAGTTTGGIDAALDRSGSIGGTVVDDATGLPIPGVCVQAASAGEGLWGYACTRPDGTYEVFGLSTDEYTLSFFSSTHRGELYDDVTDPDLATKVAVVTGEATEGIDAGLQALSRLGGTVTAEATGDGVPFAKVEVFDATTGDLLVTSFSSHDGTWSTVIDLPGAYLVRFSSGFENLASEWWEDEASSSTAATVALAAGEVRDDLDAALAPGATIIGTVTDGTGAPTAATVLAHRTDEPEGIAWSETFYTDEAGKYTLTGLAAGSYAVQFQSPGLVTEWYDDQPDFASATPVPVTAGGTTDGIDASLGAPGSISGTLTDAVTGGTVNPFGVPPGYVYAEDVATGHGVGAFVWDTEYTIEGLAAGQYRVLFWARDHASEYYEDADTAEGATLVTVESGVDTTGIDASLHPGTATVGTGSIAGRVTDAATGQPIVGATVQPGSVTFSIASTVTGPDGSYQADGLPPGDWSVGFYAPGYLAELYEDADINGWYPPPTYVHVETGAVTTGIDAALDPEARITGRVTGPDGNGLGGVLVTTSGGATTTAPDGTYAIGPLQAGSYSVQFLPPEESPYVAEYYDDAQLSWEATPVVATAGAVTGSIDAQLALGGQFAGTLHAGATGVDLFNCFCHVQVVRDDGSVADTSRIQANGSFRTRGLPTGEYRLRFTSFGSAFLDQYFDGTFRAERAPFLSVTAGATTMVESTLARPASLSGRITSAVDGSGVPVCFHVMAVEDSYFFRYECADADGDYAVTVLDPGSYRLEFTRTGPFAGEIYDDLHTPATFEAYEALLASAPAIELADGEDRTGVDAELDLGTVLEGTVTGAAGQPVPACAYLYLAGSFATACTDEDGHYRLEGLPALTDATVTFATNDPAYEPQVLVEGIDAAFGEIVADLDVTFPAVDARPAIAGRVVTPWGEPITGGACVDVYRSDPGGEQPGEHLGQLACTDLTGNYVIEGLEPGDYLLLGSAPFARARWYTGHVDGDGNLSSARDVRDATVVTLDDDDRTGIDIGIRAEGDLDGTITDERTGEPIAGACAHLFLVESDWYAGFSACTDDNGYWSMLDVPFWGYGLAFADPSGTHVTEWWEGASTYVDATVIGPTADGSTTTFDAALTPVTTLVGHITDELTGDPVEACAYLFHNDGSYAGAGSCAGPDGRYAIQGVPAGTYDLAFFDPAGTHTTEWGADDLVVAEGSIHTIDAAMAPITTIVGHITDELTGDPLAACAYLFHPDGSYAGAGSCAGPDGRYAIQGVPAGSYRLAYFDPAGTHATEWNLDQPDLASADPLVLADGTIVTLHAAMAPITTLVGHITDERTGEPIEACAYLFHTDGSYAGAGSCAGPDGRYAIQGIAPGTYNLAFFDPAGTHLTEWSDDAPTQDAATDLALADGTILTLDAAMRPIGSIAGRVVDEHGQPRADVCVYAGNLDGTYSGVGGCTAADGTFWLGPLPAGQYVLGYYGPESPSPSDHWYDHKPDEASADPVTVTGGATTGLVEQVLPHPPAG